MNLKQKIISTAAVLALGLGSWGIAGAAAQSGNLQNTVSPVHSRSASMPAARSVKTGAATAGTHKFSAVTGTGMMPVSDPSGATGTSGSEPGVTITPVPPAQDSDTQNNTSPNPVMGTVYGMHNMFNNPNGQSADKPVTNYNYQDMTQWMSHMGRQTAGENNYTGYMGGNRRMMQR